MGWSYERLVIFCICICVLEFVSSNHNSALRWQRPHLKADLFFRRAPRARTRPHVLCTNVSWISGPRHPLWNKWPYKAIGREGFDWADRSINARNVSHRPRRTSQLPQQPNTPAHLTNENILASLKICLFTLIFTFDQEELASFPNKEKRGIYFKVDHWPFIVPEAGTFCHFCRCF